MALQLELQELQQLQWQKQVQMRQNDRPAKKFCFKRKRSGEGVKVGEFCSCHSRWCNPFGRKTLLIKCSFPNKVIFMPDKSTQ